MTSHNEAEDLFKGLEELMKEERDEHGQEYFRMPKAAYEGYRSLMISRNVLLSKLPRETEDLDSVTVGSPTKRQIKLYFNSRTDTTEELETRAELAVETARYLEDILKDEFPAKKEEKNDISEKTEARR